MAKQEIEKILAQYTEETKRHFDVVAEDLKDEIGLVAEGVLANTEKLQEHDLRFDKIEGKLSEHDLRFDKIEGKLSEHDLRFDKIEGKLTTIEEGVMIIKLDIEFIKNGLKQKVDQDEFSALEKRVSLLEAKLSQR